MHEFDFFFRDQDHLWKMYDAIACACPSIPKDLDALASKKDGNTEAYNSFVEVVSGI